MFPLLAVVDADLAERHGWSAIDLARAFLDGGARLLQLRAKGRPSGWLLDTAAAIVAVAHPTSALVIVNDRADIARLSRADGVHLGQDDLIPSVARRLVGPDAIVGLSTHSLPQAQEGAREAVTYIATGPVFETATKRSTYAPVGLAGVRAAAACAGAADKPLVAIGGITLDTARDVIIAGAASVAVIADLLATPKPEARVRAYLERLTV
jgi:thiamine-phosphate pyrophosphorylase